MSEIEEKKIEAFNRCLKHLEELKRTANPHDVMGIYENVIGEFRLYLKENGWE